ESYFGEGTHGAMSWNYELQRPAEPSIIDLPADCPPGLLDVPVMADATELERLPGMTRYSTAASVAEVQAFYEEELAVLGWKPPAPAMSLEQMGISADEYQQAMQALQAMGMAQPAPTPDPSRADLVFQQAEELVQVTITRLESTTDVEVSSR
ncbi:MAG TPA: hypothetical protein VLY63_02235, partial [Anaerolineae bacterium]|nr:hypothetical protein [Anaerolineae bacterium]